MKKFLAIILTLCALTCSSFAFAACGGGNYEQGPDAITRPNVTTIADEAEWKRLLSLKDSYPCTLEQIVEYDGNTYTMSYSYNGTVIKGTSTDPIFADSFDSFFEKVGDTCYQYVPNEFGTYEKTMIDASDLGFDPFYNLIGVCESLFTYSDFTYNESTSRYENDENYVKFVDGKFSEAYHSDNDVLFKVTYGKVDIQLPKV